MDVVDDFDGPFAANVSPTAETVTNTTPLSLRFQKTAKKFMEDPHMDGRREACWRYLYDHDAVFESDDPRSLAYEDEDKPLDSAEKLMPSEDIVNFTDEHMNGYRRRSLKKLIEYLIQYEKSDSIGEDEDENSVIDRRERQMLGESSVLPHWAITLYTLVVTVRKLEEELDNELDGRFEDLWPIVRQEQYSLDSFLKYTEFLGLSEEHEYDDAIEDLKTKIRAQREQLRAGGRQQEFDFGELAFNLIDTAVAKFYNFNDWSCVHNVPNGQAPAEFGGRRQCAAYCFAPDLLPQLSDSVNEQDERQRRSDITAVIAAVNNAAPLHIRWAIFMEPQKIYKNAEEKDTNVSYIQYGILRKYSPIDTRFTDESTLAQEHQKFEQSVHKAGEWPDPGWRPNQTRLRDPKNVRKDIEDKLEVLEEFMKANGAVGQNATAFLSLVAAVDESIEVMIAYVDVYTNEYTPGGQRGETTGSAEKESDNGLSKLYTLPLLTTTRHKESNALTREKAREKFLETKTGFQGWTTNDWFARSIGGDQYGPGLRAKQAEKRTALPVWDAAGEQVMIDGKLQYQLNDRGLDEIQRQIESGNTEEDAKKAVMDQGKQLHPSTHTHFYHPHKRSRLSVFLPSRLSRTISLSGTNHQSHNFSLESLAQSSTLCCTRCTICKERWQHLH
jgi:hypothetical protein